MRVLVVCESLDVNSSSASKGRLALIESFIQNNYQVTVLHYSHKEILVKEASSILVKERKGILYLFSRMQRVLNRYLNIDISKYVDMLFGFSFGFFNDVYSLSRAIKKYRPENYDMVWTLSKGNSYRSHKALLAFPDWHKKWFAYVHDPYPQQLYPRPYNFVPYGYKHKRYFFKEITQKAKNMVFPSLLLKDWMQSYYIDIKGKGLIIPHQLRVIPFSENDLPDYFNPDKFNLLHAGSLLDLRNPEPLVKAFKDFLVKVPEAAGFSSLFFIGKASVFSDYLMKQKKQLPQLFISNNYVAFNQVYAMQQLASVNIILEAKSEISPFLPGKFPHCVAANKPILFIGPHYSECKRILGSAYKYQFDFNDVDKLTNAIIELYNIWKEDKTKLKLNRLDLEHYLSSKYLKESIDETFKNLKIK